MTSTARSQRNGARPTRFCSKATQEVTKASVTGNVRVTEVGKDNDIHHIVLDFGSVPFPVLESQSIGAIPPGLDAKRRPNHPRQHNLASARNGERLGYNNVSLTIKQDYHCNPVREVGSNYMFDLNVGEEVQVIGPFGSTFCSLAQEPRQNSRTLAPCRAFPRTSLTSTWRSAERPARPSPTCRMPDLAVLLRDPEVHFFYLCGLKAMEEGVVLALKDIATDAGLDWDEIAAQLKKGRLHLETY